VWHRNNITSDCASRPKNKCLVPAESNRLANQGDHGLRVGSNDFLRVVGVQPTGYRATDGSTRTETKLLWRAA
jgi:hypothetical protein